MKSLKGTRLGKALATIGLLTAGIIVGTSASGIADSDVTKTTEYMEVEQQVETQREATKLAQAEADSATRQLNDLQEQYDELTAEAQQLQDQSDKVNDLTSQVSSLTSERDSCQSQLADTQSQLAEAQSAANSSGGTASETIANSPSGTSTDTESNSGSTSTQTYYQNCSAARAAGAAPLYSGEPGYRAGLDRDHDGVACE